MWLAKSKILLSGPLHNVCLPLLYAIIVTSVTSTYDIYTLRQGDTFYFSNHMNYKEIKMKRAKMFWYFPRYI